VVNVDELVVDDVPLAQRLGDSMAKRLRSNKGKAVPSGNETPEKATATLTETLKARLKRLVLDPSKAGVK